MHGSSNLASSPVDPSSFTYVVGIDIGSQTCSFCVLKPDKSQVIKATDFANALAGFTSLLEQLERLEVPPEQILIGLEATSRYGENSTAFWKVAAISSACCIRGKPISLRNNGDCERKRIDWMRIPSHGCCSAGRLVVGMCQRT